MRITKDRHLILSAAGAAVRAANGRPDPFDAEAKADSLEGLQLMREWVRVFDADSAATS